MTKISRNIKRLRAERGLTQDALAEKLFITRQAVSSWENDRTQPDLEMLGKLSEVLEVSIEELLYGKKRNTSLETEKTSYNNTLIIAFSILGAFFVGSGLILIFVTFWREMGLLSRGILSLIPLLLGQAAGMFVFFRKKDKAYWCEGAGVLWTAGISATLALLYNIFDVSMTAKYILLLTALSVIPVIMLLGSISPLAVYYGCVISFGVTDGDHFLICTVLSTLLIAAGCAYTHRLVRKESKSHLSLIAHWISIGAVLIESVVLGFEFGFSFGLFGLQTVSLCLFLLSLREGELSMPYRLPGILGTALTMLISSWFFSDFAKTDKYSLTYVAVLALAVIVTAFMQRKNLKDKSVLSFAVTVCIFCTIFIGSVYSTGGEFVGEQAEKCAAILKLPAFAAFITMMIWGCKEKKLIPINVGFLGASALAMIVVAYSELPMVVNGIMLLVFGCAFLAINFIITKSKKKLPAVENNEEVQSNEK